MKGWLAAAGTALILLLSAPAFGHSTQQQPPAREENLSEKIINPIAFLMRLTAENKYSPSLWNSHGEENEVEGTFVVPFEAFAKQNLARIKLFFETSASDGTHGLSEVQIFDLVLAERSWGTLGAGISGQLNSETAKSIGT